MPPILAVLVGQGRRFSALLAIATLMSFGATPVLAQMTAVGAQPALAVAAPLGPLIIVSSSVSRVMAIVEARAVDGTESGKGQAEIRLVAVELFDLDEMASRLLGQRWSDASPEERQDFVTLFTDLLEQAYLNYLGNYRLAAITYQGESINGSYAKVLSRIAAGKGEIALEYRLLENEGRWAVYDVSVDGVGLLSNYRSQFTSMLKRMTFEELLNRLRNREASAGQHRVQAQ